MRISDWSSDVCSSDLIKGDDGYVVRLGDVAKVEVDAEDRRAWYRGNGEPQVGLGIIKTSTANSLEVARTVAAEARRISPTLPEGMHLVVAYDATVFIDAAVERVIATL